MPEDSEGSDDEEEEDGENGDEEEDDMASVPEPSTKKRKDAKTKDSKRKLGKLSASSASESESEEEAWGKKRSAYYSSNAAQLESDDEEANELEEQEAKRLQAKARDPMQDDDFGLADPVEVSVDPEEECVISPNTYVLVIYFCGRVDCWLSQRRRYNLYPRTNSLFSAISRKTIPKH